MDECTEELDICEMICVNNVGSYTCICGEGYMLNDDGLTCEGTKPPTNHSVLLGTES